MLKVNTKNIITNDGFLVSAADWSEDIVIAMADRDNLKLTEDHWKVISLVREYFNEYQIEPSSRILARLVHKNLEKHIQSIWPIDTVKQVCQYSGMLKTTGCLDLW